jgi:Lipase (class 3)
MKSLKYLLAIGLLFVDSVFAALPATIPTASSKSSQINEFNYSYDNTKMNLSMENTADIKLNNDWQPILIHGTWSSPDSITHKIKLSFEEFGRRSVFTPDWDGKDLAASRYKAAESIIKSVTTMFTRNLKLLFYGHSHGGNVAILVINQLIQHYGYNPDQIRLITLNTPVRDDYQIQDSRLKQINVFNPFDIVQVKGGESLLKCIFVDCSERTFPNAVNLSYKDAFAEDYYEYVTNPITGRTQHKMVTKFTDCSNRHCGNSDENFTAWFPMVKTYLKIIEAAQSTPLLSSL